VADQDSRGLEHLRHELCGCDKIVHVGGEIGLTEVAFALPQTGEVKAQHGNALLHERLADVTGGPEILCAGEAVGKERTSDWLVVNGKVEAGAELLPFAVGEADRF
jgi:hypothetical protein